MAEPFVQAGAHYVILDFINVDEAGGNLFPMADQVRRARRVGLQERQELRRRPEPHLRVRRIRRARIWRLRADHDWRKEGLPADVIKGAVLCSGMYDLKPVRLSKRSAYVNFTDEMEEALSAQRHLDRLNARWCWPTAPTRRRNSSASRATSPPP